MSNNIIENIIKTLSRIFKISLPAMVVKQEIAENYDSGLKDMEVKLNVNFAGDNQKKQFLENYTYDNIKGMNEELAEKLRKEFSQAMMSGESIAKMKKRVLEVMDVGVNRAQMIARTEMNRAQNTGRLDGAIEAEKSGIKTKKWLLVTQDKRTSPICHREDTKYGTSDKAIPIDEKFKINYNGEIIEEFAPPFHVNCRTRLQIKVI